MMAVVDRLLNRVTMYRLTLYYLATLLALAVILSALGIVPGGPAALLFAAALLLASSLLVNALCARILKVRSNPESTLITALILALITAPVPVLSDLRRAGVLALMGAAAAASKYLLAPRRQHVFNPAALGAFLAALFFGVNADWWVGNTALLPLVAVGGLAIARKTGRLRLVGAFLALFIAFNVGFAMAQGLSAGEAFQGVAFVLKGTALVFFATVMLTEPITSPKRLAPQLLYAGIVALLYQPQIPFLGVNLTPEESLLIGNAFSFLVSPSFKLRVKLAEQREIGCGIKSFTFPRPAGFSYRPGQYMEWTLPVTQGDARGVRRCFSIASSPTEPDIMIAARFAPAGSRYKQVMAQMTAGDAIVAGELGGDFVLPKDGSIPLAFIAGGIGITPFRSMIKYLADRGERRDIVLLYSSSTEEEIVFRDLIEEAQKAIGLRAVYTLTDLARVRPDWCGQRGPVDREMIRRAVPAFQTRRFLVSGPPGMVRAVQRVLASVGIPRGRIRTDSFLGYA